MYLDLESKSVSHSVSYDSATPRTVAYQAPLSMEFSRQEYCSGLSGPPPGDLLDPGVEPASLMPPGKAGSLPLAPPGKLLGAWWLFGKHRFLFLAVTCYQFSPYS